MTLRMKMISTTKIAVVCGFITINAVIETMAFGVAPSSISYLSTSFSRVPSNHHHPQKAPVVALFAEEPKKETTNSVAETQEPTDQEEADSAAVNTINARLMAELEEATNKEKYGSRSSMGKKLGLDGLRPSKSEEEQQAAIEEARNLNGVNPVVAITGSLFALAAAAGLWYLTSFLGEFFALHPVESDVYFIQRVTGVFRNVVMGLSSLASGFFGVTGLGIFLLGVRVAYGVATGELDPTPLQKNKDAAPVLPNAWDLMTGKKPGRRGGGGSNPFDN